MTRKPALPYLTTKRSGPRVLWYFRRGTTQIRLPDPSAPEFLAAYQAERDRQPDEAPK